MAPTILYLVCVLGALGLWLLVRTGRIGAMPQHTVRAVGAVAALGAFGWLVANVGTAFGDAAGRRPEIFYLIFSVIALASAVRMITHARPVYAALHFVLVVLASAGMFLLLEAEFMAFALIIVYAGAVLITYMFVLMLAQQSASPEEEGTQPEYDRNPREPAAGAIVGFVLLALLSRMIYDGAPVLPDAGTSAEARRVLWEERLTRMPQRIEEWVAAEVDGAFELVTVDGVVEIRAAEDGRTATVAYRRPGEQPVEFVLPEEALPENVQLVGLALITDFPVSLELAGVILLLAMFGAVILARRQIELTEDEKREAAGMRRLGHHDDPGPATAGDAAGQAQAGGTEGGNP